MCKGATMRRWHHMIASVCWPGIMFKLVAERWRAEREQLCSRWLCVPVVLAGCHHPFRGASGTTTQYSAIAARLRRAARVAPLSMAALLSPTRPGFTIHHDGTAAPSVRTPSAAASASRSRALQIAARAGSNDAITMRSVSLSPTVLSSMPVAASTDAFVIHSLRSTRTRLPAPHLEEWQAAASSSANSPP
jgi:hypothetical protein